MVSCLVPALSTSYSNEHFLIAEPSEDLKSGVYFGTSDDFANAFDDDLLNDNGDDSANCYIGTEFKEGHVGIIS